MASCSPSSSSGRALVVLPLLLASACPAPAQARATSCCPQAKARIAATEQLGSDPESERRPQAGAAASGPAALPKPSEAMRRRAFEGLRRRAPAPEIDARARAALKKSQERLASEREQMAARISQALGLEPPDLAGLAGLPPQPSAKAWVPVLFVSSSMPTATLRTYAAQLERARGVLAFRGMPGGLAKVAPMAKLSAEILRIDPGCEGPACAMRSVQVIVDPLLFRQHAVSRVPALTLVPGDPAQPYCEREETSERGRYLVLGDSALGGLLEEYGRIGGKEEARDALTRIQGR